MKFKLINEKGKLFGLINLIDLLLIVTVVVVIIAGIAFMQRNNITIAPKTELTCVEVTITVRLAGNLPRQTNPLIDTLSNREYTQLLTTKGTDHNWFITGYRTEPTIREATDSDGKLVLENDARGREDIVITIKGLIANPADNAPYATSSQELRIGMNFFIKTKYIERQGAIETLEVSAPFTYTCRDAAKPETWGWKPVS
jgi:hypothetical protein